MSLAEQKAERRAARALARAARSLQRRVGCIGSDVFRYSPIPKTSLACAKNNECNNQDRVQNHVKQKQEMRQMNKKWQEYDHHTNNPEPAKAIQLLLKF